MNRLPPQAVSVIPLPLERDSRSLKNAASLARLGWRSVVVEGIASADPKNLPVPVIPLHRRGPAEARQSGSTQAPRGPLAGLRLPRLLSEVIHLAAMIAVYFVLRPLQGLVRLPKADIYYLHEYRLFPMVWLAQLFRPAPIVYDARDFYATVWREENLSPFFRTVFLPLLGKLEAWCARNADLVVTVSDGAAQLIAERFSVTPVVIRNCHAHRIERIPSTDARASIGFGPDDILVICVDNHKPGQAITCAIEALASLPPHVHLGLVGRFHEPAPDCRCCPRPGQTWLPRWAAAAPARSLILNPPPASPSPYDRSSTTRRNWST